MKSRGNLPLEKLAKCLLMFALFAPATAAFGAGESEAWQKDHTEAAPKDTPEKDESRNQKVDPHRRDEDSSSATAKRTGKTSEIWGSSKKDTDAQKRNKDGTRREQ